ncbi:4-methylaminobutanoate oxidase (formaldehyde-forming) [Candidatus Pelagibacter ubique]|uniref:4-methylaminobutanoate oxidase (Formaldehyde-forming) n=1 Tax=Pelagibacter ubique TaxID=198252 RepID=A0ABX1T118_PELUQ|nr:FAD-dependent oxidoreductase [Candidatus Pelagibacter ubique]NMN67812.1 4-methylaminobutanoate oxidase (formaldehyde-forming) [Candidatus Pelagibacter ubique]
MDRKLPTNAKVVVIGGGVAGCSVAYHLAKFGWKDTILLERDQLTSGTTWHAAGLVGQLGATASITKLRKYSLNLYKDLEKKTELSTGLKQNGAITIASTKERLQELLRQATAAQLFDVNVEVLDKKKVKDLYPVIHDEDIYGGVYMPEDGQADPVGVTNVLAKAAKMEGVKIIEKTPVEKILIKDGKIAGVQTQFGKIDCEYVVLATGMWSRQIGEDIGVSIPLYPNEHFYIITEPMKDLPKNLPVLRDYNNCLYLKEDAGKMLVGIFEPNAKNAFKEKGKVPNDFSFGEFPDDFDHFEPYLEKSFKRLPMLETAGIRKFFSGPESFTPDTQYLLGETAEVKNLFTCCGFNSIGIASSGGAGRVTAEWMINGYMNEDLYSLDIKRFQKFHSSKKFIMERVTETLGDLYGMHWPYKQHHTSRNQRILPYHDELKKEGACFGVSGEYERPMWYARNNEKAKYEYSFDYQNWYPSVEYETNNTITNVGLYELSPFSKYEIKGELAHIELQRLCTANIKNEIGRSTYTQMLNVAGGIETDLTVICIKKDHFRIISSAATRTHDKAHILKHLSPTLNFEDITDELVCLGIFGPKSRDLISKISKDDFKNEKFKFGDGKFVNIDSKKVWVQRLSYVGELGFEIYIDNKDAKEVYQLIVKEGKNHNLSHCGSHAMDTMRMESGFLHWGHDISPEENQYEAGLNFAISFKKEINFIGKESLLKLKEKIHTRRFIMLSIVNSKPGAPLLLHEEPIYLKDKIIGRTTSGNYSFNYKKNLSFGYVKSEYSNEELGKMDLYVEVAKIKYPVMVEAVPLKDKQTRLL